MRILFFEPFGAGSHLVFAEQLMARSGHAIDLETLPARHWKWRQRSSAFPLSRLLLSNPRTWDLVLTCSLVDVALLRGLCSAGPIPPIFLYFHENQWTYPASDGSVPGSGDPDFHLAFTNLTSLLTADAAAFNSRYHLDAFMEASEAFLGRMPDCAPLDSFYGARDRARVLYPGITGPPSDTSAGSIPLILWNHRWEHDKNPDLFLQGLRRCRQEGLPFRLALLGERYRRIPPAMAAIRREFASEIVANGHLPRREYQQILKEASLTVSTAYQENFGLAAAESVLAGAYPLFPSRLSYPELLPGTHHAQTLYREDADFPPRLAGLVRDFLQGNPPDSEPLQRHFERYTWEKMIESWDTALEEAARSNGGSPAQQGWP